MTDTPERNDRGIVIGGGPFQPPTKSELELLRSERDDLANEVKGLKDRNSQLEGLASRRGRLLDVTTVDDLQVLLGHVMGSLDADVTIEVASNSECLSVEIYGIVADDDDNLTSPVREFEVSTVISFEHTATIRTTERDVAHDLYVDMLQDRLRDVEITISGDEVEEQYSSAAEFEHVNVSEF